MKTFSIISILLITINISCNDDDDFKNSRKSQNLNNKTILNNDSINTTTDKDSTKWTYPSINKTIDKDSTKWTYPSINKTTDKD